MEIENKISRRKFLTVSAGAAAALICVGCGVKVDQTSQTINADPTTTPTNQSAATNPAPANTAESPNVMPTATPVPAATQTQVVTSSRCPKGLINDPYPGRCRRYIDQNGNGFCDLSEVG